MSKQKRFRRIPNKPSVILPEVVLEQGSIGDIEKFKQFGDKYTEFHWYYYFFLTLQRGKIIEEIKKSIRDAATKNFKFTKWQRVVRYKYSAIPFSVAGSLLDVGGRFNIGDISSTFASFPSLYIAENKDTALQEYLCQKIGKVSVEQASAFALADPTSLTNISLSGSLGSFIDLRDGKKLQPFIDLVKDFSVPDFLIKTSQEIKEPISIINTVPALLNALLIPNWRLWPMQFDVPVTSQIFGQLVVAAGVEGIIYPSKFTGKECLSIFPQNFDESSNSFVELDDESPIENKIRRLDVNTWRLHQEELQGR